jgi:hypothetical protein
MTRRKKSSVCRNCGKKFFPLYSSFGKYCNLRCQKEYQNKERVEGWLSGIINPINTNGLLKPWARRYIFKINHDECCLCGWQEINKFTGKIPLEVDHVDGNYMNNKLDNLKLLCPNCHSLSGNYKSLNKGKGRKGRK